ncbi:hypothetical protein [Qipengyuania spongiae]|uniref:Uncharacterized protein n=1 Tax=Qipengyuania spongiae TaxID=2909673 RepID=A0ABY5SY69_9SPHN|nr:hypothetical protein [Qipengyuania spongiae]UVI39472.1 hypothetical protein L1F33_00460 [Qipengyuania spongiae]
MISRFNPAGGIRDFWDEFRKPNPLRLPILLVSTIPMALTVWWAMGEKVIAPPERPKVTYISTLPEGRTDEEIRASNIENQRYNDRIRALQAERDEEVRDMYRQLGRATGLDVDAMEAEIQADRAEQQAPSQTRSRSDGGSDADPR